MSENLDSNYWLSAHHADELIDDAEKIGNDLARRFRQRTGKDVLAREKNAWPESTQKLVNLLKISRLTHEQIVILEYSVPPTSLSQVTEPFLERRVDAIICGQDKDRQSNAILLELKLWDVDFPVKESPYSLMVQIPNGRTHKHVLHPSVQVAAYMQDFRYLLKHCHLDEYPNLSAFAYLPKYLDEKRTKEQQPLFCRKFSAARRTCSLYSSDYTCALAKQIRERVSRGNGEPVIDRLFGLQIRARQRIQDLLQ